MEYKEKFKEAKRLYETANADQKYVLESLFPELTESEDEKIRKSIIAIINNYVDNSNTFKPKMIAWLEKQGEQNPYRQRKESEDERTWIINYLSNRELNSSIIAEKENLKKAIAWLEKIADKL